ncbi:hypothetical protein [Xenorhabdus szentirmaii]|uniref:Uncharacterized protein n=1 Tax=Xenorhabdus szentirmaii TaxID=290112 RepID=A0AAW3YXZ9_9GAMM|nr:MULTISPECIES: hypothetical protein [unclassified Xenorhabdus]MBD2792396.1 hypothetical protein [Xenorhabdus sp. CUL]MBD2802246.1 hypothetical protein [Xenorhabdus sp. M]MBD2825925.1 hypothetical protein [Xenorhabdus sp. 5]
MNKYLEDALAFFKPAPDSWVNQVSAEATGEWIWEVLKGDFHDDPSTAQVVMGTVISVIPYVDQICDIRDLIANCKKIREDENDVCNTPSSGRDKTYLNGQIAMGTPIGYSGHC